MAMMGTAVASLAVPTEEARSLLASLENSLVAALPVVNRRARSATREPMDADDVASTVAVRFLTAARQGTLGMVRDHAAYLVVAVRTTAIDLARVSAHQRTLHSQDRSDEARVPEDLAAVADTGSLTRRILDQLPERQRIALTLVDAHGHSLAEAGAHLGIGANAVAQLLHRARRGFRLAWAVEMAGPAESKQCDRTVLNLFAGTGPGDHPRTCTRCAKVQEAHRGSQARPVATDPGR